MIVRVLFRSLLGAGEVRRVRARFVSRRPGCCGVVRVGELAEVVAERVEGPFAVRAVEPA